MLYAVCAVYSNTSNVISGRNRLIFPSALRLISIIYVKEIKAHRSIHLSTLGVKMIVGPSIVSTSFAAHTHNASIAHFFKINSIVNT